MMGNPLMNVASLSQTAGRAKTRQPGLVVKPTQSVLSSYLLFISKLGTGMTIDVGKVGAGLGRSDSRSGQNGANQPRYFRLLEENTFVLKVMQARLTEQSPAV
jgi:hypothetical protein